MLGVPKAGWCPLGCHVGSSAALCSQCYNHIVSAAVNREEQELPLKHPHGSCGGVKGVWQPWECHIWHLSLLPPLYVHSGHGSVHFLGDTERVLPGDTCRMSELLSSSCLPGMKSGTWVWHEPQSHGQKKSAHGCTKILV